MPKGEPLSNTPDEFRILHQPDGKIPVVLPNNGGNGSGVFDRASAYIVEHGADGEMRIFVGDQRSGTVNKGEGNNDLDRGIIRVVTEIVITGTSAEMEKLPPPGEEPEFYRNK